MSTFSLGNLKSLQNMKTVAVPLMNNPRNFEIKEDSVCVDLRGITAEPLRFDGQIVTSVELLTNTEPYRLQLKKYAEKINDPHTPVFSRIFSDKATLRGKTLVVSEYYFKKSYEDWSAEVVGGFFKEEKI